MGDTVQKLTVKMPWSQKLKQAEVSEMHVPSGAWIGIDDEILTLVTNTGRHVVRAANSGRIVMLVASGDKVTEGDPLYVLRLEAQPEPAPMSRPDDSAPRLAAWRGAGFGPPGLSPRLGDWAWFVLAVGVYALAARLLIPWLPIWFPEASSLRWMQIAGGLSVAGLIVFALLARRGGRMARRMTWGVAACWALLTFGAVQHQSGSFSSSFEHLRGLTGDLLQLDPESGDRVAGLPEPEPARVVDDVPTAPQIPRTGIRVGTAPTGPEIGSGPVADLAVQGADQPEPYRARLPDPGLSALRAPDGGGDPKADPLAPVAGLSPVAAFRPGTVEIAPAAADLSRPAVVPGVDPGKRLRAAPQPEVTVISDPPLAGGAPMRAAVMLRVDQGRAAAAPVNVLPYMPPRFARISLLFQYVEDPRAPEPPGLGTDYEAELPPDVRLAVTSQKISAMRAVVQVTGWCIAAGDASGIKRITTEPGAYRRVGLSDRLRLVLVDLTIEADTIGMLSDALPIFGGEDPGFFHNRRPVMGGWSGATLLDRGEAWLGRQSNRMLDPNFPAIETGGTYFFKTDEVLGALAEHGCTDPVWQGGAPVTALGRAVELALTP